MEGDAPAEVRAAWVELLTTALALCLVAFVLYTALRGEFSADIQRGIPFAGIAIIILARHPVVAGARWLRLIDVLLRWGHSTPSATSSYTARRWSPGWGGCFPQT